MLGEILEPKTRIYISFHRGTGLRNWFIKQFTGCEFTHVEMEIESSRGWASASPELGVYIKPQSYDPTIEYKMIDVSETQAKVLRDFVYRQEGKPYDWYAIFGILFYRQWDSEDRWFCSELIAAAFARAGISLVYEPTNWITPADLFVSVKLMGNFK